MISVSEATEIILQHALSLPSEEMPLERCIGRVLREDLIADRDFPPFDRVTMDGIAIDYQSWQNGTRSFKIQEVVAAGEAQKKLKDPQQCIEIMTGAILPEGCDTIIRYEDVKINNKIAEIQIQELTQGHNIHQRGSDRKRGAVVVPAGEPLSAAEIGVAATIGKLVLKVAAVPKIALVSTGDELVDIDASPLPHQIRRSNVYQIKALLEKYKTPVKSFHLADDPTIIEKTLRQILDEYDCVILSGGVSEGKYDYVPDALQKLGVEKIFHRVSQRPGKPFWFGIKKNALRTEDRGLKTALRQAQGPGLRTEDWGLKTVVFALPGNPVSSFMCTVRYVIPWLKASLGIYQEDVFAMLAEPVTFRPALTYFLQVLLEYRDDSSVFAIPVIGNGSGDLANLVNADAFLELPEGKEQFADGEVFRVWGFR